MNVCSVEGCGLEIYRTGLCRPHKARLERTGTVSADIPIKRRADRPSHCIAEDCVETVVGGGYCAVHYARRFNDGWRATRPAKPCEVDGCEKAARSKGLCTSHYAKMRRWGTPVPPERPKPKHTKRDSRSGYVMVKAPDSPMAMSNGYVVEHRLVMAEMIGRPLEKFENVHHINGVKDDNRPENLELWNTYQPAGQRPDDKVEWAVRILELYAPDRLA